MHIHSQIAGTQFRKGGKAIIAQLEAGTEFILQREPENEYDSQAIAVYCLVKDGAPYCVTKVTEDALKIAGVNEDNLIDELSKRGFEALHIGYIPKADNGPFARAMDSGTKVRAKCFAPAGNLIELWWDESQDFEDLGDGEGEKE